MTKRFTANVTSYKTSRNYVTGIKDNETNNELINVSEIINVLNGLSEDKKILMGAINCKYKEAERMIKQQYNLPIGTDLSYWIGVANTCKRLIDLIETL